MKQNHPCSSAINLLLQVDSLNKKIHIIGEKLVVRSGGNRSVGEHVTSMSKGIG